MFLLGLLAGSTIGFFAGHGFKKIRSNDDSSTKPHGRSQALNDLMIQYPEFMAQFASDVLSSVTIKEFFVVDKEALLNSAQPRHRYDLNDDVLSVMTTLEHFKWISKIPNNCLLYKINEQLIVQLKIPEAEFGKTQTRLPSLGSID